MRVISSALTAGLLTLAVLCAHVPAAMVSGETVASTGSSSQVVPGQAHTETELPAADGLAWEASSVPASHSGWKDEVQQTDADVPMSCADGEEYEDPEPATLVVWSLLGLGWLALRRFWGGNSGRRGAGGAGANRGKRREWTPEARRAIMDIVEQGRRG
jgi:hypothetical protein